MPMNRKPLIRLLFACLVMLTVGDRADAAAEYAVEKILPQIGQRGTTVDVVVYGTHLQTAQEVLFFQPGIECVGFSMLEEALDDRGFPRQLKPGQAVLMKLKIAPDCPPGEHLLRIRTADALSEMVAFWVTTLPVVQEEHPWADRDEKGRPIRNDSPEFAQAVPLNSVVSGICSGAVAQDHDWYAIDVKKGQSITVELLASRLGTHHYDGLNDPTVSVHDERGRQLVSNDDNALHLQDPIVQFVPEKTGRFFIHVRQSIDYETGGRPYGMHVGTFPRPLVCFPLGAKAGEVAMISLLGDIRGRLEEQVVVPTPGPYEAGEVKIFAADAEGHHSFWPNRIRASELPDFFEPQKTLASDAAEFDLEEFRYWTTAGGKKSSGQLKVLRQMETAVDLERSVDRRVVTLPLESLSQADRDYLEARSQAVAAREAAREDRKSSEKIPHLINQRLPVAINGVIESRGETDWFRFSAKKGDRYRVRTYAATLDSELDARVIIKPAEGNLAKQQWDEDDSRWEPHDLTGHHYRHQTKLRLDPVFMFEPKTDGDWLIGISDTRREGGPRHVYRVEFEPHIDSAFVTHEPARSQNALARDRVVLFPGRRSTRPLLIQKGFGSTYNEPLQLRAEGLPAGVTMEAPPFRQGDGNVPVTFIAEPGVKPIATLVDLIVEPVDPTARESFRGGFVMNTRPTDRRGGFAMCFRITRRLALAVVEGAAFDLAVDPPRTPLVHNGTLDLTVRVNRQPGFAGAVYLEADWLPPGVERQPPLIIKAAETAGTYRLKAGPKAVVGDFPFIITGREYEGGDPISGTGFHYVCSPSVPVTVGEPHLIVTLLRAAIERGQAGTITAEINHHKPFAGEAELRLGRLPFGVEQIEPIPRATSRDTTATFHVKVTKDCLTGLYRDIYCEALVQEKGQTIREESGSGMLRVDPERN
jgi:hypothetical protein